MGLPTKLAVLCLRPAVVVVGLLPSVVRLLFSFFLSILVWEFMTHSTQTVKHDTHYVVAPLLRLYALHASLRSLKI